MAPAPLAAHASSGEDRRSRLVHVVEVLPKDSRRHALAEARLEAARTPVLRERLAGALAVLASFFALLGMRDLANDVRAEGELIKFGLIASLLSTIVLLLILAKFLPKMFESNSQVVTTINDPNVTTGDSDADAIKPVFGFVIAISFLIAIVGLVLTAVSLRQG